MPAIPPYRSAQKLERDNCLSEITDDPFLKDKLLDNLGITDPGINSVIEETTNLIKGDDDGNGVDSGLAVDDVVTLTGIQTLQNKTLTAPNIGVATATTVNKVSITQPLSGATLTVADGKALTASNTLTLAGTDGTTMTFPATSATLARTDAANTFTGHQTIEGVTSTGATGSGNLVFDTSPSLVTPNIGTPSAGTLTNCNGLPASGIGSGTIAQARLGTGSDGSGNHFLADDQTYKAIPGGGDALTANPLSQFASTTSAQLAGVISNETGSGSLVFATSPALVTPDIGTPSAGTLTNCTGLPVATGVSGLAAGVATFLATPSSANLASAVTNETGSGALVFATSPTLVTPILGTPTSGTLSNCTGLPASGIGSGTIAQARLGTGSDGSGTHFLADDQTYKTAPGGLANVVDDATPQLGGDLDANGHDITGIDDLSVGTTTVTSLKPATDDGAPLGDTTHNFSDLFLASGAVINYANGNAALSHSSGILTVTTGDLRVTTAGTNAASVVTVDGTQTLTNKSFSAASLTSGSIPDARFTAPSLTSVPNETGGWNEYFVTGSDATAAQSLTDITGLVSGTLSNSAQYEIEATLILTTADSNGTKLALHGGGTGSAATCAAVVTATSNSAAAASAFTITTIDSGLPSTGIVVLTGTGVARITGFVTTRSTGTATISIQHAHVTSGNSTCKVGSMMRIRKAHT